MILCCVRRHPGHLCRFTLKDVEHATPRLCHLHSHCLGVESGIVLQEWELSDVQPRALSGLEDLETWPDRWSSRATAQETFLAIPRWLTGATSP
jgi:hypothetical protein